MRNVLILHQFALKELSSSKKNTSASSLRCVSHEQFPAEVTVSSLHIWASQAWSLASHNREDISGESWMFWIFKQQNWGFANDAVRMLILTGACCFNSDHLRSPRTHNPQWPPIPTSFSATSSPLRPFLTDEASSKGSLPTVLFGAENTKPHQTHQLTWGWPGGHRNRLVFPFLSVICFC